MKKNDQNYYFLNKGDAEKSLDYFEKMGYPSPAFVNPSTFFMKLMNPEGFLVDNIEKTHDYGIKLTDEIRNQFKVTLEKMINFHRNSDELKSIKPTTLEVVKFDEHMNTVSWFKQFRKIAERGFLNEIRNPMDVKMKLMSSIFFGILTIIVFTGVDTSFFKFYLLIFKKIH